MELLKFKKHNVKSCVNIKCKYGFENVAKMSYENEIMSPNWGSFKPTIPYLDLPMLCIFLNKRPTGHGSLT